MPSVHPVSERANKDMILRFEARTRLELYRQEPESVDEFLFTVSAVCTTDRIMLNCSRAHSYGLPSK